MLFEEPFAFLSVAAEAITHPHQQPIPDLIESLMQVGSMESQAMASAVAWFTDTATTDANGDDGSRVCLPVPDWLEDLDCGRIVQAKRRRERPNKMSYLFEIELVGGWTGTLQGRIDHDQDGALTNAWVTDESLATIEGLIVSLTKRQPDAFRPVNPATAANALARAVEASEGADIASPHVNRWPALRPLVEFALVTWSTA